MTLLRDILLQTTEPDILVPSAALRRDSSEQRIHPILLSRASHQARKKLIFPPVAECLRVPLRACQVEPLHSPDFCRPVAASNEDQTANVVGLYLSAIGGVLWYKDASRGSANPRNPALEDKTKSMKYIRRVARPAV